MHQQSITLAMLTKMAAHFKKLKINEYDNTKTEQDWLNLSGQDRLKAVRRIIELGYAKPYHGDAFHWIGQGYRNENLFFYHAEKGVIYPYTEIDDYGSVPPDFRVGNGPNEFLPDHWLNIVDHNNLIFLSDELVEQVKAAISNPVSLPFVKEKGNEISVLVEIKDNPYKIVVKKDCKFTGLPWATVNRSTIYFQGY